ncbi:MAG: hypothetical protein L6R40_008808, partial [Gallowayella cf. fulva]
RVNAMINTNAHPLAGQFVTLNSKAKIDPTQGVVVAGAEFRVEDYADRIMGGSIWAGPMTFAVMHYMARAEANSLPMDDKVLYGKINGLGHMVHESEIDAS